VPEIDVAAERVAAALDRRDIEAAWEKATAMPAVGLSP
jgi:hypothetical protein